MPFTLNAGLCGPDAATGIKLITHACCAQLVVAPAAVDSINVNELMNINDVRDFFTIFTRT